MEKIQQEMIGQSIVFVRVPAIYVNPFLFGFSNPFQSHPRALLNVVFKAFGRIVAEICFQRNIIPQSGSWE
jgi:hypothetical protein